MGKNSGEERRNRDDDPNVGGKGIGQGDIFQKVVQCGSTEPRPHEIEFVLPLPGPEPMGVKEKESHKSNNEADKENFHRGKIFEEDFGGNKGCPPHEDGTKGDDVPRGGFLLHGNMSFPAVGHGITVSMTDAGARPYVFQQVFAALYRVMPA